MATASFNPTGTCARFESFIETRHSDSALAATRSELINSASDAFSMFARSDNRTAIEKITSRIKDNDANGTLIRQGVREALNQGDGFRPSKENGPSFVKASEEVKARYIALHGRMMAVFETAIAQYGVKQEKTPEQKEKAKIEKTAKAEKKLQDSIKALGLVRPEEIRPLDNNTMINLVIDACRAGELSLPTLEGLFAEVSAALDIAKTAHNLELARMENAKNAKAKATRKMKAEKDAITKEPIYVQTAVASATA